MELFPIDDLRKNGRPAGGEERRREGEQAAEQVKKPALVMREDQDKTESDHEARQIANDHDEAAVQPVEMYSGGGSGDNCRQHTRDHDRANRKAGAGQMQGETEDGDAIKVVPDLADNLSDPGQTIVPVIAQQSPERAQSLS